MVRFRRNQRDRRLFIDLADAFDTANRCGGVADNHIFHPNSILSFFLVRRGRVPRTGTSETARQARSLRTVYHARQAVVISKKSPV